MRRVQSVVMNGMKQEMRGMKSSCEGIILVKYGVGYRNLLRSENWCYKRDNREVIRYTWSTCQIMCKVKDRCRGGVTENNSKE